MRKQFALFIVAGCICFTGCTKQQQITETYNVLNEAEDVASTVEEAVKEAGGVLDKIKDGKTMGDINMSSDESDEEHSESTMGESESTQEVFHYVEQQSPEVYAAVEETEDDGSGFGSFNKNSEASEVIYLEDAMDDWKSSFSGSEVRELAVRGDFTVVVSDNAGKGLYYNFGQLLEGVQQYTVTVDDVNYPAYVINNGFEVDKLHNDSVLADVLIEDEKNCLNNNRSVLLMSASEAYPADDVEYRCELIRDYSGENGVLGFLFTIID